MSMDQDRIDALGAHLARAANHVMTPAEVRAQKVSFIRGQTDHEISEDEIRRIGDMPSVEEESILAGLRSGKLVAVPRDLPDSAIRAWHDEEGRGHIVGPRSAWDVLLGALLAAAPGAGGKG